MDELEYYSEDYASARERFRVASRDAGLSVVTMRNPLPGPAGLELTTDVARAGAETASKLLVLVSGVHGVELLCGSACQSGWLAGGGPGSLPPDTAVLLVHALNCWGAAWGRRNTEYNVDLCRNFLDFSQPLPASPAYEQLHATVCCAELTGPARRAAERALEEFQREHGPAAFIDALMGGQYSHADGFQYGGAEPVWSNKAMGEILARYAGDPKRVAFIEYHSGLGPYAYGTAVTMHRGAALERTRDWFGNWVLAVNEREPGLAERSHQVRGHTTDGYVRALPRAEVTSIVLEYGTYAPQRSLPVLLKDHWLEHHGDPDSETGRAIRRELWALHHPSDPEWRRSVWHRSQQVLRQAFRGLAS